MSQDIQERIKNEVESNAVVVYMKGTPTFPQCGFSAAVVDVFRTMGVPIHAVNVLDEEGYRDGIKAFTNWPTIPQVFVGGQFIGGCDITREMFANGELHKMVEAARAARG